MSDQSIIDEYIRYVSSNHRKSSSEIYLWHLLKFSEYLSLHNHNLHKAQINHIIEYVHSKQKWDIVTTRHFYTIVKMFYKWYLNKIPLGVTSEELRQTLQRQREINEIIDYKLQRQSHKTENKALDLSEVKMLLEEVKKQNEMDYNILYLFFYFGWRKGEMLKLNPTKNIIWKENRIHLTSDITKNYLERDLYFNDNVKQILINILKNKGSRDRLYVCDDETYLNRIFSKYDYVLGKHLFPHVARHTFNTQMLQKLKGMLKIDEVIVVKNLMGHVSNDMSVRYLSIDLIQTEAKRAMLELHYLYRN